MDRGTIDEKVQVLRGKISTQSFMLLEVEGTHYAPVPEEQFKRDMPRIEPTLLELGYAGMYVDLAYVSGRGVRLREKHGDKTEVYFMLAAANLILGGIKYLIFSGKRYNVKRGDVVVIPKGVNHKVKPGDARYLMANIRKEKPTDVPEGAFKRL